MVIFGGLELVVGGYVVHRIHKNRNEKKRAEEEWNRRRQNTYPGARPSHHHQQHQQQQQQTNQSGMIPQLSQQQKYPYYAPQPQAQPIHQPIHPPRPHTAQTFPQNRPYPQQAPGAPYFQPQIQPLRRADSCATISNMPVANGSPPQDAMPLLPPRPQQQNMNPQYLQPYPQNHWPPANHPYNHAGFSVSSPSFSQPTTVPVYAHSNHSFGRNTIDEPEESFQPQSPHVHFSGSTHGGNDSDEPPPPYRP